MTAYITAQQIVTGAYIYVDFPAVNKNDELNHNDSEIQRKARRSHCRIARVIDLELADFCDISRSLLADRDLWGKIGGSGLSPIDGEAFSNLCRMHGADADDFTTWHHREELASWFYTHSFTPVVAVTCQGQRPFFVNTEGYTYARYVGRAA